MRVRLKGIATATKKLADGSKRTYYYAWRGGPKLDGEPGTPAFVASYNAAIAKRNTPSTKTVFSLIVEYKASGEWSGLSEKSRKAYTSYLKLIEAKFGTMPISGLSDPDCRGDFMEWRDGMQATPRKADYAWTTLARVLAFAKNRGRIPINPCERGGRLYSGGRAEKVWGEAQIAKLLSVAPQHMATAIVLALWTGQRQGDLLGLPWSAYDGKYIRLQQSKTGRRVTIPVGKLLKDTLDGAPRVSTQVITNSRERPWTSDGFRTSWGDLVREAGLGDEDLTFNDFRGTAVTRLALAGATEAEIATITGHSLDTVRAILDRHYLSRDVKLAESAIRKLERNEKRTNSANR